MYVCICVCVYIYIYIKIENYKYLDNFPICYQTHSNGDTAETDFYLLLIYLAGDMST